MDGGIHPWWLAGGGYRWPCNLLRSYLMGPRMEKRGAGVGDGSGVGVGKREAG